MEQNVISNESENEVKSCKIKKRPNIFVYWEAFGTVKVILTIHFYSNACQTTPEEIQNNDL